MGMETVCLGLAIAFSAFWALTVVEVGISLINSSLLSSCCFFLCQSYLHAYALCQLHITKPGAAAGEWNQVRSVSFFIICHDCCGLSNNVTPCLCMDRQNVTRGIFPLGITSENMI